MGFDGPHGLFDDLASGGVPSLSFIVPNQCNDQHGRGNAGPAWGWGHNAIVLLWDENDYSATPNTNQVLLTVETNFGVQGVQSDNFYTHFSLLKSLEGGFGLPCLNHACDPTVSTMSDLFAPVPMSPVSLGSRVTDADLIPGPRRPSRVLSAEAASCCPVDGPRRHRLTKMRAIAIRSKDRSRGGTHLRPPSSARPKGRSDPSVGAQPGSGA